MKKLIFLIVVGGLFYFFYGAVKDYRADMLVDEALMLAEGGNYERAMETLDIVDSMFASTSAAERTEEARAQILQMQRGQQRADRRRKEMMEEQGRQQRERMESLERTMARPPGGG